MHILISYWDLTVGGVQHMSTKLANALVSRGHRVTIAIAHRKPEREPYVLDTRVKLLDFGTERVQTYIRSLTQLLRETPDIDVIFSATTVPNLAAVLAKSFARSKARLVISERDNPFAGYNALSSLREKLTWRLKPRLYRLADEIVCVSTPLADSLAKLTGIARERLTVIHNPAFPEHAFQDAPPPHPWLANRQVPVVIAAGRFHPQKDFPTLIRAFSHFRRQRPARLILLGDGPERADIESTIDDYGTRDDVLLPGMQKDIMPWLLHADVFVMSSEYEGFGNVLVQALAAGNRIVSTDCPDGPAEILSGGRHGRLVPVGDAEGMATAIGEALDAPHDPALQRSRSLDFSVEAITDRYEHLFARR